MSTLPSPMVAISGWFISSLRVASKRSRSTVEFDQRLALGDGGNGRGGILQRILERLVDGADEALHRLRLLLHELLRDDDGIGIEIHAVVAVVDVAQSLQDRRPSAWRRSGWC